MAIRTGVIVVIGLAFAASAQTTRIPDVIPHPNPAIAEPMWVSASRAVTEEGDLDAQMLAASSKRNLESLAARNQQATVEARRLAESPASVADCQIFTGRVVEHFRPNRSPVICAKAIIVAEPSREIVVSGETNGFRAPQSVMDAGGINWVELTRIVKAKVSREQSER